MDFDEKKFLSKKKILIFLRKLFRISFIFNLKPSETVSEKMPSKSERDIFFVDTFCRNFPTKV